MDGEIKIDIDKSFHEVLRDIENIFWFFILSNKALSHPDVQNILKLEKDDTVLSMLRRYNEWVGLNIEINYPNKKYTSKLNLLNSSVVIGKIMAITTYEILLASKYYSDIKNLEEFKFLKHIRNGAAHNNRFNFKNKAGRWTLNENEIIKWQNQEISRNLQNRIVFNEFISFSGIFLLVNYFSEKLEQIDQNKAL